MHGAERPVCVRCGSDRRVDHLLVARKSDGAHVYWRCRSCDLIFEGYQQEEWDFSQSPDQLSDEQAERFQRIFGEVIDVSDAEGSLYPTYGFDDAKEMENGIFAVTKQLIEAHLGMVERPRVLEVGCATGFLLRQIKEAYPGTEELGIEPSPISAQKALAAGLRCVCGTLDTVAVEPGVYDVVLCWGNLMLHADPFRSLAAMRRALRPGGILIFEVKNVDTTIRRLARAAYRVPGLRDSGVGRFLVRRSYSNMRFGFSKRGLRRYLPELGFEILDLRTTPPRLLAYDNSFQDTRSVRGLAWRALDRLDGVIDQRAWIRACCRPAA